jgi:hypothetical protein
MDAFALKPAKNYGRSLLATNRPDACSFMYGR